MSLPASDQQVSSTAGWDEEVKKSKNGSSNQNQQKEEEGGELPDSTSMVNTNARFAAALTAKLDSLTDTVRGSPPDLGDYENPDSMETQGDALCVGSPPSAGSRDPLADITDFDLNTSPNAYTVPDCDPDSTFFNPMHPTIGPVTEKYSAESDYVETITGEIFNEGPANNESGDITSDKAAAGVCGMSNLGNTCYMNSGLQCLLASPTIVDYFLHFCTDKGMTEKGVDASAEEENKSNTGLKLSKKFASLVQQVYVGKFTVIQPVQFKEALSESHDQFKGYRQHDCQEFLALLLDTLHEQLVGIGGKMVVCPRSECTSMELHTPHSTEASCTEGSTVFNFSLSGKMLDKDSESEVGRGDLDREFESVSEVGRADLENVNNIDGMESRGSASPKSYTSHSSLEDKIPSNIRMAPIPECIKTNWMEQEHADSRTSLASLDSEQEDASEEGEGAITSNLVPCDQLKKKQVVFSDTVSGNFGLSERNNAVSPMNVGIEDFYKEHKTLNVNMNNESTAMNNKINFDSEKYRHDNTRPPTTIENLNTSESSEKIVNVKRLKCTNMETGGTLEIGCGETDTKRIRLDSREKNIVMETERKEVENDSMESQTEPPSCCSETARDPARLKEAIEADRYWEKYLAKNNTIVAHSFQGQFKNTVICGECSHVSVSFEPFMYLSVPLPRALDRQIEVVIILDGELPTSHLLTLSTHDRVQDLRDAVTAKLDITDRKLVLAEVTRHRISRQLEDNTWLKFVNTTNRKVYCIEPLNVSRENEEKETYNKTENGEDDDGVSSSMVSLMSSLSSSRSDLCPSTTVSSSTSTGTLTETGTITDDVLNGDSVCTSGWLSCNICMEDMTESDLLSHVHCTAQLCKECLDQSMNVSPDKCPVCLAVCDDSEWVRLDRSIGLRPPLRILSLPVLMLMEQVERDEWVRIGHPRMMRVANTVRYFNVSKILGSLAESVGIKHLRFCVVNDLGEWCSRCPSHQHCRGCQLSSLVVNGELILKPGDVLGIVFPEVEKNILEEINRTRQDASMETERLKEGLDLFDCLDAFSSREILDHNNPWFCPICRKNQNAIKTLSVWRYPDFLIIYLKRFIYLERGPGGHAGSVKLDNRVSFPLSGLDLTPYLSGPLQQGGEMFDLYGAVCHYGSVSGGHYTAYAKHNLTQQWNHFNDAQVESRIPEGEGQDDVYVLFYKRSGLNHEVNSYPIDPKASSTIP